MFVSYCHAFGLYICGKLPARSVLWINTESFVYRAANVYCVLKPLNSNKDNRYSCRTAPKPSKVVVLTLYIRRATENSHFGKYLSKAVVPFTGTATRFRSQGHQTFIVFIFDLGSLSRTPRLTNDRNRSAQNAVAHDWAVRCVIFRNARDMIAIDGQVRGETRPMF